MNKKLIRLTESDLHNIVKESVNKILTELDWKTYASAGKKAGKGGSIDMQRELNPNGKPNQWLKDAVAARHRADKFYQQAKNQFNKDYGYKNGKRYDADYSEAGFGGDFTSSEEFSPHAIGYRDKGYGNPYKYEYGRRYDGYAGKDMTPEEFYQGNEDAARAYRNADDEIRNWKKGNYDYQNGKGWQLKK